MALNKWFSREFDDPRNWGVVRSPTGGLAWGRKSELDKEAETWLKGQVGNQKYRKRGGSKPGSIYKNTKHRLPMIMELFSAGVPIRRIAVLTGLARMTVRKHIKRLNLRSGVCVCGKVGTHQAWCRWRYKRSPSRQAWMRSWWDQRRHLHSASATKLDAVDPVLANSVEPSTRDKGI